MGGGTEAGHGPASGSINTAAVRPRTFNVVDRPAAFSFGPRVLVVFALSSSACAQMQAERAPGVAPLETAQCPNGAWRDSCGECSGDGGSCGAVATVSMVEPLYRGLGYGLERAASPASDLVVVADFRRGDCADDPRNRCTMV